MEELLKTYLLDTASPEMWTMVENAIECFKQLGFAEYEQAYDELLMLVDNADAVIAPEQFYTVTRDMLEEVLNQHGIYVTEEAAVPVLTTMTQALITLDEQGDPEAILSHLEAELNDEERFVEILASLTEWTAENLMVYVERVNPGLLRRIGELMVVKQTNTDESPIVDAEVQAKKVAQVKKLFDGIEQSLLMKELGMGMKFNLPFETYVRHFWPQMVEFPALQIARELLGMAVVSADFSEHPMEGAKQCLAQHSTSLDQIAQVSNELAQLFVKLQQAPSIAIQA